METHPEGGPIERTPDRTEHAGRAGKLRTLRAHPTVSGSGPASTASAETFSRARGA
jgi:hypothetical protein